MLTHGQIWAAIDALAERHGLSISSLAKKAGLDPTTFNRSKRMNAEGQPRWPSTESIAKVLAATGVSVDQFIRLLSNDSPARATIPFRPLDPAMAEAFDAEGQPVRASWQAIAFPGEDSAGLFALEVRGSALAPCYRDGDIVVLSASAQPRRGDRVLVIGRDGDTLVAVMGHETATHVQLTGPDGVDLPPRPRGEIRRIARIVWVSQ